MSAEPQVVPTPLLAEGDGLDHLWCCTDEHGLCGVTLDEVVDDYDEGPDCCVVCYSAIFCRYCGAQYG